MVLRHRLGDRSGRGRRGADRAGRAVLARRRTAAATSAGCCSGRAARSPRSTGCSAPTTPRACRGCVAPRRQGVEYDVEPAGDRLLIVHNDGAEDFELAEAPLDATQPHQWRPVLPHQAGRPDPRRQRVRRRTPWSRCAATGSPACTCCPRDRRRRLRARAATSTFDEPLLRGRRTGRVGVRDRRPSGSSYGSMVTPDSVYDYDLTTGELTLLKRTPGARRSRLRAVPARAHYVQERGWATARRRHPGAAVDRPPGRRRPGRLGSGACSTATARTRSRWTRRSRSPGCRCSTAASCTRSPTSAAAASWAAAGTSRARR